MPKPFPRAARIAEEIQHELAGLIHSRLNDPRIGLVTLTGVEVSPDYAHAKVFFTRLGLPAEVKSCLEGLNRAAGFLRAELSHHLGMRGVPQLHFVYDESVERGVHLSRLIDAAAKRDADDGQD
jgi:ribosome-binding factor A